MPQMMPMNWLMLFILVNLSYFVFILMIYYSYNPSMTTNFNESTYNDNKSILNFWPLN